MKQHSTWSAVPFKDEWVSCKLNKSSCATGCYGKLQQTLATDENVCKERLVVKKMPTKATKRPKYYTPNEVSIHNTLKDLWVSFLGKVYDLTPLCEKNAGKVIEASNSRKIF